MWRILKKFAFLYLSSILPVLKQTSTYSLAPGGSCKSEIYEVSWSDLHSMRFYIIHTFLFFDFTKYIFVLTFFLVSP